MIIEFEIAKCQSQSDKKIFGLCDDPSPAKNPAYIDDLTVLNGLLLLKMKVVI
jgi:hypothetical protein